MASKTQITKVDVALIPSTKMEGLAEALAELKQEAEVLPKLKTKIDALVVTDAQSYADMGTLLTQTRSIGKVGAFKINPFLEIAARVTNFLRNERSKHEDAAAVIANVASMKMSDYKRQEREAAQREQDRINEQKRFENDKRIAQEKKEALERAEEIRKDRIKEINRLLKGKLISKREAAKLLREAGVTAEAQAQQAEADAETAKNIAPPQVSVQSNVPKVAGTRGRVQYYAEVIDEETLIRAYAATFHSFAASQETMEYHAYLRQFITVNEQALGKEARDVKDSAKLNAKIPGVKFWDKDAV